MRVFLTVFAFLLMAAPAFAADEFGARFGGSTPTALQDEAADPMAEGLQALEPAAGDEEPTAEDAAQDPEALADQPEALLPQTEPSTGELVEDPAQAVLKIDAEETEEPALPQDAKPAQ